MIPEERELLRETAELTKENNKILRAMRRSARFAMIMRIIYWAIIIGGVVVSYYAIQPFINPLIDGYKNLQSSLSNVKDLTTKIPSLTNLFGGKQ
jgi:hypothetical protein